MSTPPHVLALLLALLALAPAAPAQDAPAGDDDRIADLEREVEELKNAYGELLGIARTLKAQLDDAKAAEDQAAAVDEFYIPRQEPDPLGPRTYTGSADNIYNRPFLTQPSDSVHIGGYIDLEFLDPRGEANKEFDQHRFVPFLYADVSDGVKVATEVEIEHGSELEVEFAQMDFLVNDHVNLRAGIQLLPLGKLNAVHDSPIQDLTFRPLVNRYIIPTTLRDAGLGAWGNITDTIDYQVTVTNGFKGLDNDGNSAITAADGLRDASPQADELSDPFENLNDKLAWTSRVGWTPELGVEAGLSALWDTYDEAGDNDLRIVAVDATLHGRAVPLLPDNMELLYEGAWADISRNNFARTNGVAGNMDGHYVQANVHFAPDFLDNPEPGGVIEDGAHFTFVTRYGKVALDDYRMRRTTLGLNFRPNETHTVVKLDYLMNDDSGSQQGTNNDNAWAMSVATYF